MQREDFVLWYLGVWQGKYQASSDYLRLYLISKMLRSRLNSHGVAADEVTGPSLFCTPSHDSKSQWRHMVIIFISISLPQHNNSTGLSATFDNSVSIKHSRHFQGNKLEKNCGSKGPALPFLNSAGCISALRKKSDLLLAALKMVKGKRIGPCLHCQSEVCLL